MSRAVESYLVAGFLLACLFVAGTYAYDLVHRAPTTRDLQVGHRYRIGRRSVRCEGLGELRPGAFGRVVTFVDEETGERLSTLQHVDATFPRAWWWSR